MSGEESRNESTRRPLRLAADLLSGKVHSRVSAAKLLGIGETAAYRQLGVIAEELPGMAWDDATSPRSLSFDRTKLANPPDYLAAVAACFGLSLAPLFEGAHQEGGMRRAFNYVLGQSRRRKVFRDIERKFTFLRGGGESALPERSGLLDDLVEAVLKSTTIRFQYRNFQGEVYEQVAKPLSLGVYDHQLYLLAETDKGTRRPFRFSRIELLDESYGVAFDYPGKAEYDPRQLFADSFGVFVGAGGGVEDVSVKLARKWLTHARSHRWHHSQRVEVLDSGAVMVNLRVRVCPELQAWVLGFGAEAEVMSPDHLRNDVAEQLRLGSDQYRPLDG